MIPRMSARKALRRQIQNLKSNIDATNTQEMFVPPLKPCHLDGASHSNLMDGAPALPDMLKPGAAFKSERADIRRSILFLDELRLTRDCMTEFLQEQCPQMTIIAMPCADYGGSQMARDADLIIVNLHRDTIVSAMRKIAFDGSPAAAPVLFIATHDLRTQAITAVEQGAAGLISSNSPIEILIATINLIIAGGRYFPNDTIAAIRPSAPGAKNST